MYTRTTASRRFELNTFLDLFAQNKLSVCVYGSHRHDIDVVIITEQPTETPAIITPKYDIWVTTPERFSHLVAQCDPIATEPLLTGNFPLDCHKIGELPPPAIKPYTVAYLEERSRTLFSQMFSELLLAENVPDWRWTTWHLTTLSYAVSYAMFSLHYAKAPEVATLTEVLQNSDDRHREVFRQINFIKRNNPAHFRRELLEKAAATANELLFLLDAIRDVPR